uniref:G-protein coupled receptors family 3 profile domain-containing protein n=1 Tax=Strigamia maritima TaxID=126957 RepID=T1J4D3_STRMM
MYLPQISYASTSTELSDKARFDFFSRVVPPDNLQAQAMVDILKLLGWSYVSTVAVEGDYGEKGIASFTELAEQAGMCVAVNEKIARNAKPEDFDRIIDHLAHGRARAVVLFVDEDNCRKLLEVSRRKEHEGHFLWVGSDSWGAKIHPVKHQESAAQGAITILPKTTPVNGFDEYFKGLRPSKNTRNVWFDEFWMQHFNCSFTQKNHQGLELCTDFKCIRKKNYNAGSHFFKVSSTVVINQKCVSLPDDFQLEPYKQEGLVPFVVDAVFAMAHALHNMMNDVCLNSSITLCPQMQPKPEGHQLLSYIRNVSFMGLQGREVRFNEDGDPQVSYVIYQYQKRGDKYEYHQIGDWSATLNLNLSLAKWPENSSSIPSSVCSEPCPLGHIRNYQGSRCCWLCVACRTDEFIFNDTCTPCESGYAPTPDQYGCYKLPVEYIKWSSPWALVPIAFASLGITFTIFVLTIFIRYNTTPVIMASGRELCYVLLIGILLCYSTSFVVIAKPNAATCALLRVSLGLCLCICYAAILTKTNRISRIFNRGIKSIKRPSYTSPRSQIVICIGLVTVQMLGSLTWLAMDEPRTREVYPSRTLAVLQCGISNVSLIVSLAYNMILIVLCTVYAFKTRKIPENFNEAKYVGFTMYSTCIVWLAFVPIYFGTNNDYKIQIASICMCINISASVALGCLFIPKVYIVLLQPYKNVRQGGIGSHSSGGLGVTTRTRQFVLSKPSTSQMLFPRPVQTNGDCGDLPTSPSVEESSVG